MLQVFFLGSTLAMALICNSKRDSLVAAAEARITRSRDSRKGLAAAGVVELLSRRQWRTCAVMSRCIPHRSAVRKVKRVMLQSDLHQSRVGSRGHYYPLG